MAFLRPNGSPIFANEIIGQGTHGLALYHGPDVLKVAKVRSIRNLEGADLNHTTCLNLMNTELLEREKQVYERLKDTQGIACCLKTSQDGILLKRYNESLEQVIDENDEPDDEEKSSWISQMIKAIRNCHQAGILLFDIALRNFLLCGDRSIKLIDFAQCAIFDEGTDMSIANDNGLTAKIDIFHLGCAIYSVSSWQRFEKVVLEDNKEWPDLSKMPQTEDMLFGDLIRGCWKGRYKSMDDIFRVVKAK